jgi:hypothetical protein
VSAVVYTFVCANCVRSFTAPEVQEFSYGQFVMRSVESPLEAFLDAAADSAFAESWEMLKTHRLTAGMPAEQKRELQHRVFGDLCDRTPDGHPLEIGLCPRCPFCGKRKMANWQEVSPVRSWPLPIVTHECWDGLNFREKGCWIEKAIRRHL